MDLQLFTQVVISSLLNGVAYGSVGLAFVTVYRVTSVINFPEADLGLVGAFVAISLSKVSHLASVAGAIVASAATSALIYLSILYPLRRASLLVQTIALLGGGIALQSLLQMVYGNGPQTLVPLTAGNPILINGAAFPLQGFWVLGWGVVLVLGLYAFFERTLLGRFSRFLAGDVGPDGITVNCIAPSFIPTGLVAAMNLDAVVTTTPANTPLGRLAVPDDIAGAAAFLASKDASFITGAVIDVNGGSFMQ